MSQTPERIPWGEPPLSTSQKLRGGRTVSAIPAPSRRDRQRAAAELERGALIAVPTETVYGIAARADHPQAVAKLRELKSGDDTRALTWHIGSFDALERFPRVSPMARRLMQRYWPGPLTLVLPGVARGLEAAAQEGWTGVRFPAHKSTAQLLAKLDFPVVVSSANRHGQPPIAEAEKVAQEFGSDLALILDGGPPRLNEASVILRVGPQHFEILREGILDLAKLRETAGLRIAFVCTGNTCRSPMAEAIARDWIAKRLEIAPERLREFGFEIASMGVTANVGVPVASYAVEALSKSRIPIEGHYARPVLPDEISRYDRVYAMTRSHLDALADILPPGRAKHFELLDPAGGDVPDPIGGTREEYERCAALLQELVVHRAQDWV
jgi:protein-tyrosine phosphatase